MTDDELLAGSRNAGVYVYEEASGDFFMSVEIPRKTIEYAIPERLAREMEEDLVDGETIRKREEVGDW